MTSKQSVIAVYRLLLRADYKGRPVVLPDSMMAAMLGRSIQYVQRALRELERLAFIRRSYVEGVRLIEIVARKEVRP